MSGRDPRTLSISTAANLPRYLYIFTDPSIYKSEDLNPTLLYVMEFTGSLAWHMKFHSSLAASDSIIGT
jgi:hypothetical protein